MEKRKRIGDRTLVVGMDIGQEFNAACLMDNEGKALGRYARVSTPGRLRLFSGDGRTGEKEAQVHQGLDRHGADRPLLEEDRFLRQRKRLRGPVHPYHCPQAPAELDESSPVKQRYQRCVHDSQYRHAKGSISIPLSNTVSSASYGPWLMCANGPCART